MVSFYAPGETSPYIRFGVDNKGHKVGYFFAAHDSSYCAKHDFVTNETHYVKPGLCTGSDFDQMAMATREQCDAEQADQITLSHEQFRDLWRRYPALQQILPAYSTAAKLRLIGQFVRSLWGDAPKISKKHEYSEGAHNSAYYAIVSGKRDCLDIAKGFIALAKAYGIKGIRLMSVTTRDTYRRFCPVPGQSREPLGKELLTHQIVAISQGSNRWLIFDPHMARPIPTFDDTDYMTSVNVADPVELQGKLIDFPGYHNIIFKWFTGIHADDGLLVNYVGRSDTDSLCLNDMDRKANVVANSSNPFSDVCAALSSQKVHGAAVPNATLGFEAPQRGPYLPAAGARCRGSMIRRFSLTLKSLRSKGRWLPIPNGFREDFNEENEQQALGFVRCAPGYRGLSGGRLCAQLK